ncbi:MAG: hypothetical protein AAF389_06570 [Gemmatimonadota bacterium]
MSELRQARWVGPLLWVGAVLMMASAAIYQRRTGPTYPLRGEIVVGTEAYRYALVRSQETTAEARVAMPKPGDGSSATITYRRFPTNDEFTTIPLVEEVGEEGPELAAYLPIQAAAGKIEYNVEVQTADGTVQIPEGVGDDSLIILRYKDPVPTPLLVSHVIAMFFTVLVGMRTGLGALFAPGNMRTLTWATLIGMTLGGLVLGPFVQKYAFGAYWTGFPWGYDLTDNKLLIMWFVWVVAASVVGTGVKKKAGPGRAAVAVAAACMVVVYLIPHSMRGSELDYAAVDSGVPPAEAVGTGAN